MRQVDGTKGSLRGSALWGKPKGESRSSALWGKPGRGFAILALVAVLAAPVAATAGPGRSVQAAQAIVPASLMADAEAHPAKVFSVIVQGSRGTKSSTVAGDVGTSTKAKPGKAKGVKKRFTTLNGVSADLTGAQIVDLATRPGILAITPDARVQLSGQYSNTQNWPQSAGVSDFWTANQLSGLSKPAAIAVVDSGIQAGRTDFSGRVVKQVTLTGLAPNSPGDGRGHGTFVAGIAAGSAGGYAGADPIAPIISIDVMDDNGMAMTSDVIAAADWILANKAAYNIRVANFSLQSTTAGSFMYDPLDKAVERLWFNGVVVVAAAGNYGVDGQPTTVAYAPGNDPFVITVGAADTKDTGWTEADDVAAPWSAYGYTLDGFAKPDVGAPGRHLVGPAPSASTMATDLVGLTRVTAPGYMWMSGTSFAAPVVSGAAALILTKNPNLTPDQVKGALMYTAAPTAAGKALGVGEVNAKAAYDLASMSPLPSSFPNSNLALNQFVGPDGTGGTSFDSASWSSAATASASWNQASWNSASWANASWANASWNAASWAQASWAQASWASASWNAASWAQASWAAASWNAASWAAASWVA
jgi:serine protease AprX